MCPTASNLLLLLAICGSAFGNTIHSRTKRVNTVDRGPEYGSVSIKNSCDYDVFLTSVGAWRKADSHDQDVRTITAGGTYTEPYREVCPLLPMASGAAVIPVATVCPELNKLQGEGVSMKITRDVKQWERGSILQLEYALVHNPSHANFLQLNYDISLLDCAVPKNQVTDSQAAGDAALNQVKVDKCPGYQTGLALHFNDTRKCRPIYCDGKSFCQDIYNYDATRKDEASFSCIEEYKGPMYFELCVGKGDGKAISIHKAWAAAVIKPSVQPYKRLENEAMYTTVPEASPTAANRNTFNSAAADIASVQSVTKVVTTLLTSIETPK